MRALLEAALAAPTEDVRVDVARLRDVLVVVLQRSLELSSASWPELVAAAAERGQWDHWRAGGLGAAAEPATDPAPEATRDLLAELAEELLSRGEVRSKVWEGVERQAAVESPQWAEGKQRRELIFAIESATFHVEHGHTDAVTSAATSIAERDTFGAFPGLPAALRSCASDLAGRGAVSRRSRAQLATALAGTPFAALAPRLAVAPSTRLSAAEVVASLGLEPLPVEGGLFRQTWRHDEGGRVIGTATYAALTNDPDSFSAMHRLDRDELWHFYVGDPVQMVLLHPDGEVTTPVLGSDLAEGESPQVVVRAGTWMGAELVPGGEYAVFGNTMAPGFESGCYEGGVREDLAARWPAAAPMIERLTRPDAPLEMPEGL